MSKDYTQFDWARDRYDRERWADEEERLMAGIDRRMDKCRARSNNRRNHRNGA